MPHALFMRRTFIYSTSQDDFNKRMFSVVFMLEFGILKLLYHIMGTRYCTTTDCMVTTSLHGEYDNP